MSGNVPSELRLGESVRRLLEAVVTTGATPDDLAAAATAVDSVTAALAAAARPPARTSGTDGYPRLVGDPAHPVAPQLTLQLTDDGAVGHVEVGPVFQGGPGLVHGGIIALLIDHAMGYVANQSDRPAMTASLTLRYRRPTPLGEPLTVAVRLDREVGRKLHLSATISAGGHVTAEADAIFVRLTEDNLERVFIRA
jgi:acyl-coenzyme A thioesterase PaaI-like protein